MGNIVNPAGYQKSKEALKMSSDTDGWANSISTYIKDGGDVNAVAALVSTSAFLPGVSGLTSSLGAVTTSVTQIAHKANTNKAIPYLMAWGWLVRVYQWLLMALKQYLKWLWFQ